MNYSWGKMVYQFQYNNDSNTHTQDSLFSFLSNLFGSLVTLNNFILLNLLIQGRYVLTTDSVSVMLDFKMDNFGTVKRPSNRDTEEDLLKFQKEFEEQRKKDPNFRANMSVELISDKEREPIKTVVIDQMNQQGNTPSLLKRVTELSNIDLPLLPQESTLPFPKAVTIDYKSLQKSVNSDNRGKKSLFALHMEKHGKGDIVGSQFKSLPTNPQIGKDVEIESRNPDRNELSFDSVLTGEGLASGSTNVESEIENIHNENINRLKHMTKEEILEEQEKLRASLDPNLLDFLQSRKRKKDNPTDKEVISETDSSLELETSDLDIDIQSLLGEAKRQKWKHFDVLESEKIEWMQTKEKETENVAFSKPRFDFEGRLIPLDRDMGVETGLFHHGDETTRPGYSLEELVRLADSSFQSQKIISLQTLAFIARNAQNDISIDEHLQTILLKVLVDIGVPMIFRIAMDNTAISIICLGVLGIRNLLVNTIDCDFLDNVQYTSVGVSLPLLNSNSKPLKEGEEESTDLEELQNDLVQGLIKTNILTRIKYIIDKVRPPPTSVTCLVEILTHIARYSKSTALQVVNTDKLMELVVSSFLPFVVTFEKEVGSYGECCVGVVKLCFHLVVVSRVCATLVVSRVSLFETLLQFALLEAKSFAENSARITELIISSLQTLRALACYGIGLEYFQTGYETFIHKLQYCSSKFTELNEDELNCLTSLIQYMSEVTLCLSHTSQYSIELLNPIIQLILRISQKVTLSLQIEIKVCLQRIASAVFYFFKTLANKSITTKFKYPAELISYLESFTTSHYISVFQNKLLRHLFNKLTQFSATSYASTQFAATLLHNREVSKEYIATTDLIHNLISFQTNITTLLSHLKIKSVFNTGSDDVITLYLQSVVAVYNRTQYSPAFHLLEVPLIYKLTVEYENLVEASYGGIMLCQKLIFFLTINLYPGQDFYLNNVFNVYLFKQKFYQKHRELTNKELHSIHRSYTALLQFCNVTQSSVDNSEVIYNRNKVGLSSLSLPTFTAPIFPIDWLTMPIFVLYNKEESKPNIPGGFQTHVRFLTDCLQYYNWVEASEIDFLNVMHPSTRVARVMVALMLGDMFLTEEINRELTNILQTYSRVEFIKKLSFAEIQGVTDFCELYIEFCSHFTSVSFGDPVYAQFILLPLVTNPPVEVKLVLWRNNTDIFRLFPIPISDITLPISGLLSPYETDTQVLTCMIQMLLQYKLTATWCPVFYFMAIHHVRHFIRTQPNDSNETMLGNNFILALLSAENILFEDFVAYDEGTSLLAMNYKKTDISGVRLEVSSVYRSVLESCEEKNSGRRDLFDFLDL